MIGFHFLNLDFRTDRKHIIIGNLETHLNNAYKHCTFHKAEYGKSYESSDAMCDAAVADGFEEFDKLREVGRGTLGYLWGTNRIMEAIAADEKYAYGYYNQDDKLLLLTYPELEECCHFLTNAFSDPFLFLQLSWYTPAFGEMARPKVPVIPTSKICKGVLGTGDSGLLMSREGAKFLRETFKNNPNGSFEVMIGEMVDVPGTYSIWDTSYAIKSIDTRWFGHDQWVKDQDRILVDQDG